MTDGEGSAREGPGAAGTSDAGGPEPAIPADPAAKRPMIERLGLASIALVLALMFGGVSFAAWTGGELFLAVMAAVGALMTAWAGAITLTRG